MEQWLRAFDMMTLSLSLVPVESCDLMSRRNHQASLVPSIESHDSMEREHSIGRLGDYRLIRVLGQRGASVVYEARHDTRGEHVALKTLRVGDATAHETADRLNKVQHEFRTLIAIDHPNLVRLRSFESDGAQWFITMELVEGVDFLTYVRPKGTLELSKLRESLRQLTGGIDALHQGGVLHRDLKPANVLLTDDGRLSILDFGLVVPWEKAWDRASLRGRNFVGTPRYAAPEQVFGKRFPATDWYAVGAMLYEALTGEPPFVGTRAELLIRKQSEDAPSLVHQRGIPGDLARLASQLLQRDPALRPGAATIRSALQAEH